MMLPCTETQMNSFPSLLLKSDNVLRTLKDKTPRNLQHIDPKPQVPVLQLEWICNSLVNMNQGPSEIHVCTVTEGQISSYRSNARNAKLVWLTKPGTPGSILPNYCWGWERPLFTNWESPSHQFLRRELTKMQRS